MVSVLLSVLHKYAHCKHNPPSMYISYAEYIKSKGYKRNMTEEKFRTGKGYHIHIHTQEAQSVPLTVVPCLLDESVFLYITIIIIP